MAAAARGRARGGVHPPRRLPAQLHPASSSIESVKLIDFGLSVPNKPEFWHAGQSHGQGRLHGADRADSTAVDRPAHRYLLVRRQRVSNVYRQAAVGPGSARGRQPSGWASWRPTWPSRVPGIDPALAKQIQSYLEPEPKDRCPTFEEFLKRLKGVEHEDCPRQKLYAWAPAFWCGILGRLWELCKFPVAAVAAYCSPEPPRLP